MKILFIHEVDLLEKVVFEIHSIAEILSLMGHQVFAIDYENNWKSGRNSRVDLIAHRMSCNLARAYEDASVRLIRPGFIKLPGLGRLTAFFSHYAEIEKTIVREHIDVIVLYSVPTNGIQTICLARKHGIPVVFRSIDILNQLVPYRLLRPATTLLEQYVYRRVNLILTLSPALSKYVIHKGAPEEKVKIFPLGVDTSVFNPSRDATAVTKQWGLAEDEPVILYMGTLFDFCGLDGLIPQFPKVLRSVPKAKLLIVGDGPMRARLDKMIRDLGLSGRVIITGFQPFDTMPLFINLSRICVNPFVVTDATREIIPGKIFQYLACARPVVGTPLPGIVSAIPERESGLIFARDADEMIETIISLLQTPEDLEKLGRNALEYVRLKHDYRQVVRGLEKTLEQVVNKGKRGT